MGKSKRKRFERDDVPPCPECGGVHWRDGYLTCIKHQSDKSDGLKPCLKYPIEGLVICTHHGGNTQRSRAVAQRNVVEARARAALAADLVNVDPTTIHLDPIEGLLWEVALSAQAVEWLAQQIGSLDIPDATDVGPLANIVGLDDDGEPVRVVPGNMLWGTDHNRDLGIHVLWDLWNQERERHARMCERAIRAGVQAKLVQLATGQGAQVAQLIFHLLDGMELTPDQYEKGRKVAAGLIRSMRAAQQGLTQLPAPTP